MYNKVFHRHLARWSVRILQYLLIPGLHNPHTLLPLLVAQYQMDRWQVNSLGVAYPIYAMRLIPLLPLEERHIFGPHQRLLGPHHAAAPPHDHHYCFLAGLSFDDWLLVVQQHIAGSRSSSSSTHSHLLSVTLLAYHMICRYCEVLK